MNTIDQQIGILKKEHRVGLMTHVVVGYPTRKESKKIIQTLLDGGVDFLELQIPFSDPIADGPTIMTASYTALKQGMNTDQVFMIAKDVVTQTTTPILLMCYYNQIFRYGTERFIKKVHEIGIPALIVPDIPPEEEKTEKFIELCKKYGVYSIRVISPTSSTKRILRNIAVGKGFIYCVSRLGVTGSSTNLDKDIFTFLSNTHTHTHLPLAVGFGISKREHIQALKEHAQIVIIGSAIIDQYNKHGIKGLQRFIKMLKAATI